MSYGSSNIAAAKRLRKELQNLERSSHNSHGGGEEAVEKDDVYLRPTRSDNILHWTALLKGPVDTPYEGGVFQLSIACTPDYPLAPPKIQFITKIFHPNVHFQTGDVCLDILQKEWSPAWGLQAACRAIVALLSDPDATSPLNCDAGNMVRDHADDLAFFSTARLFTVEHAMFLKWPSSKVS
jgi:peroxin-4